MMATHFDLSWGKSLVPYSIVRYENQDWTPRVYEEGPHLFSFSPKPVT